MERKLATIREIGALAPIDGADSIEVAEVDGWRVVVKKGEFKPGDLCVYFEIDSIVPDMPVFEFMKVRKFRVRTIKLRGQISQGLALPISSFPEIIVAKKGADVTEQLGVKKYDPEAEVERKELEQKNSRLNKKMKHFFLKTRLGRFWFGRFFKKERIWFPGFIKKTDEERIQNMEWVLGEQKKCFITEKLDGQSATYFLVKRERAKWLEKLFGEKWVFGICSRNVYMPTMPQYAWVAKHYGIEAKMRKIVEMKLVKKLLVWQGEIIGHNIQGNKYKLSKGEYRFFLFNKIYDGERVSQPLETDDGIFAVPYLGDIDMKDIKDMNDAVMMSLRTSRVFGAQGELAEGVVVRSYDGKLSFKAINPEFLLKHEL